LSEFRGWLKKSQISGPEEKAWCTLCRSEIQANIAKIRDHVKTMKHKSKVDAQLAQKPISRFLPPAFKSAELKRARLELRISLYVALKGTFRSIDSLCEILNQKDLH